MVNAFKLSMRTQEAEKEQNIFSNKKKEQAWWRAGHIIIYPESKLGLTWGLIKSLIIFISLFTFTYSAAFYFEDIQEQKS